MKWNKKTILKARKDRGLTQEKVAIDLGCRQQTVSYWEQGRVTPSAAYSKLLNIYFNKDTIICDVKEIE